MNESRLNSRSGYEDASNGCSLLLFPVKLCCSTGRLSVQSLSESGGNGDPCIRPERAWRGGGHGQYRPRKTRLSTEPSNIYCAGSIRSTCDPYKLRPGYQQQRDRKSTRLNSSHLVISYAVFCL